MRTVTTIDEFLDFVRKSALVEDKQLDSYLRRLESQSGLPSHPVKLAGLLVKDGLLTGFQAEQLLRGKHKGFVLDGKFKVLELLGVGGMGTVYLCEHILMRRLVALKVVPRDKAKSASAVRRFHREARAAAALTHVNIVRAYDFDQAAGMFFLVMEYVDGTDLQDLVSKRGPLSVARAAHYIGQAAQGLQHAHEAGCIHRDIKPSNLLLERSGTIKILDMGLARLFTDPGDQQAAKEEKQVMLGTADYISPEQALSAPDVDIRSDIYSLGATFYYLLTGQGPCGDGSVVQKLMWQQSREPAPLREVRPEVPEKLARVIAKMMAKDPAQRYQTPADVIAALQPWTKEPISPPAEAEMPRLNPAVHNLRLALAAQTKTTRSTATKADGRKAAPGKKAPLFGQRLDGWRAAARARPWLAVTASVGSLLILAGIVLGLRALLSKEERDSVPKGDPVAKSDPGKPSPVQQPKKPVERPFEPPAVRGDLPEARPGFRFVIRNPKAGTDGRTDVHKTLLEALRQAGPGDQIVILDDRVAEQLALDGAQLARGITVRSGLPQGKAALLSPPANLDTAAPLWRLTNVEGLTLKGFTFDGEDRAETLLGVAGSCPGLKLEDVEFTRFKQQAVTLAGCSGEHDRPVTFHRVRWLSDWDGASRRAVVFEPGPSGINQHVVIHSGRFEGQYDAVVLLDGSALDVAFTRNRVWTTKETGTWKGDAISCRNGRVPIRLNLTVTGNTFCRVVNCLRFEALPEGSDANRIVLRDNLIIGADALVAVDSPANVTDTRARPFFPDLAGNVTRPGAVYCPHGLFRADLRRIDFGYLDLAPKDDQKFLRYSKDSPLMKAGTNGGPVGVPPTDD